MTSTKSQLLVEEEDGILILTLNCEAQRNAATPEIMVRLSESWRAFRERPELHVAIVTGAGDRSFCAGGDLKRGIPVLNGFVEPENDWERSLRADAALGSDWALYRFQLDKPVISALNGDALGGGCELMLATDLRVAAEGVRIGLPEPKRGLVPGGGGIQRLPRQIPRAQAMEVLLTAEPITAERALELGLLNAVVPRSRLLDAARELAHRVVVNAPLSLQAIKRTVRETESLPLDEAIATGQDLLTGVFHSRDAQEGQRAFAEKRSPVWRGE
jgi:enoyl-CoA hydratase